jgi:glycosyl transferase family 25
VVPVLYINLDHDSERRAHIERALAQDKLELIRIRALEPPFALPDALFSKALSVGEIGCYASHMKAWDMLLVSGRPHALVLEDDARVPPNLAELVDTTIAVLPENWDLVHLYDNDCHPSRPLHAIGADYELVRYSRVPGGCVGYLISRSGAKRLRRQELRCWPLDTDLGRPWHFLLSYGIRPPLVEHDSRRRYSREVRDPASVAASRSQVRCTHSVGQHGTFKSWDFDGGCIVSRSIAGVVPGRRSANSRFGADLNPSPRPCRAPQLGPRYRRVPNQSKTEQRLSVLSSFSSRDADRRHLFCCPMRAAWTPELQLGRV